MTMGWVKRMFGGSDPEPTPAKLPESVSVNVTGISEVIQSVVDQMNAAHAAQIAAIDAKLDAQSRELAAFREWAERITTNQNSLRGLVNKRVVKVDEPEQPPIPVLGAR